MLPRVIGAGLGFLAFSTTILLGLWVGNPTIVTLTRSIYALFIFSVIGLAVGWAAEVVVREHENGQLKLLVAANQTEPTPAGEDKAQNTSTEDDSKPMGT